MDDVERGVEEELDREAAAGGDTEVVRPPATAGDRRWTDEGKRNEHPIFLTPSMRG